MDERMKRLAASVFTDEQYGTAISEDEVAYDEKLSEIYRKEIEEAKKIISTNSDFNNLSYQEKIIYVLELLNKLRTKNHGNEEINMEISNKPKEKYADIDELLNTIPQEDCGIIFDEDNGIHKSR